MEIERVGKKSNGVDVIDRLELYTRWECWCHALNIFDEKARKYQKDDKVRLNCDITLFLKKQYLNRLLHVSCKKTQVKDESRRPVGSPNVLRLQNWFTAIANHITK